MFIRTENELKLKITVPPIENKANKFVVEYIAKSVKLPKTSIEILKGDTSREKVLFLSVLINKSVVLSLITFLIYSLIFLQIALYNNIILLWNVQNVVMK